MQNLILVDEAELSFGPGLNILTGETGSGKSDILSAIREKKNLDDALKGRLTQAVEGFKKGFSA